MDNLVKALKTANQQQIDLINKLIGDCAELERKIKFLTIERDKWKSKLDALLGKSPKLN